jgi:hypothetical protein
MSGLKELRSELRALRKTHCPPVSKLKKADIKKEIDRLKEHKPTEVTVPESKPRMKKVKKETREMEVQTEEIPEEKESMKEKMARLRAMRKIGSALKKNVAQKKEKAKKEEAAKKVTEAVRKVAESKKAEKKETKKKIAEEAKKAVEKKKEKKEREMMGEEDVLSSKKRAFEKMMREKEEEELPALESMDAPIRPANRRRKLKTGGEVIAKVNKIEEKVEEKVEEKPVTKKKQKVSDEETDEFKSLSLNPIFKTMKELTENDEKIKELKEKINKPLRDFVKSIEKKKRDGTEELKEIVLTKLYKKPKTVKMTDDERSSYKEVQDAVNKKLTELIEYAKAHNKEIDRLEKLSKEEGFKNVGEYLDSKKNKEVSDKATSKTDKDKSETKKGNKEMEEIKKTLEENPYVVIDRSTYMNISRGGSTGNTNIGVYKAIHKKKNIYDLELVYIRKSNKDISNTQYEGKPKRKSVLEDVEIKMDNNGNLYSSKYGQLKRYTKASKRGVTRDEVVYFKALKELTGKDIKPEYTEEDLKELWYSGKHIRLSIKVKEAVSNLQDKGKFSFDNDDTKEERKEFFEDLYFGNPELFKKAVNKEKPDPEDIDTERQEKEFKEWKQKKGY